MEPFYRPTWVEISLDALEHNLSAFRKALSKDMRMMAVVKANAYGHGAVEIARKALECGACYIAVAFLDEAMELRAAGIAAPILVLGYTPSAGLALARELRITTTVFDEQTLGQAVQAAAQASAHSEPLKVHIKLDTGMGRLGFNRAAESIHHIGQALSASGLEVEGLFTHYACADEADKSQTIVQYERFRQIVEHFVARGVTFPLLHAGNSATAIDVPELSYNMARLGISMYGLYPSAQVGRERVRLEPVMSFKTNIVMVKSLPPSSGISYNATYRTTGEERIATLPVGYADGMSRVLSNRASVLLRGCRAPVVGNICMDQCMIDVTSLPGEPAAADEEVVLFGAQGGECLPVEEWAELSGTIPYEVVSMISRRVPRVYVSGGRVVKVVNLLR